MKPSDKLSTVITALLIATLACDASSLVEPTATPVPTDRPSPTPTPAPTDTPTATPTPTATATNTATPTSTRTPTPGPGDVIYHTDFDDFIGWGAFPLQESGRIVSEVRSGSYRLQVDSQFTYAYAFYRESVDGYSDIVVETVAQRAGGTNRNNISLVCRASDLGWYEFSISSGGIYDILRFDIDTSNYTLLASGGSTSINLQSRPNKLVASCQGDEFTWIVNDVTLTTAHDSTFSTGERFGLSVSTFDIGDVTVTFDYFTVTLP